MPSRLVIDDNACQTWNDGVFLQNFWLKLDHAQKQWLTDLAEGKVKNHSKAIEDKGAIFWYG